MMYPDWSTCATLKHLKTQFKIPEGVQEPCWLETDTDVALLTPYGEDFRLTVWNKHKGFPTVQSLKVQLESLTNLSTFEEK